MTAQRLFVAVIAATLCVALVACSESSTGDDLLGDGAGDSGETSRIVADSTAVDSLFETIDAAEDTISDEECAELLSELTFVGLSAWVFDTIFARAVGRTELAAFIALLPRPFSDSRIPDGTNPEGNPLFPADGVTHWEFALSDMYYLERCQPGPNDAEIDRLRLQIEQADTLLVDRVEVRRPNSL